MSYFLGMEILTGIVDGKLKFCVIEDQGTLHPTAGEADSGSTPLMRPELTSKLKAVDCYREG